MQPLARLRLQLTAWYAGVFSLVLALLGAGLFLTIRHQISRHVDKSLSAAAAELEDEYTSLIETFAAAALAALLLVAGGGYLLIRKSTAPVERSMDQMRRFMADAAHELRTPITILRTRAEVALEQDREAARDAGTLRAVEREAARLGEIVRNLLTLARADAGERPVARLPLYLDDVAAEAVDAVRPL